VIKLLLVEDQTMVRGALSALLALEDDIEVVAEAGDGIEAVTAALVSTPDVAVVDIELPGQDGLAVASQLRTRLPSCRVLIVTTFGRPGFLRRAMEAGAAGFLLKDAPVADLAVAIRRVHGGERVVDPQLAIAALREGDDPLTVREHEVLAAARDHGTATELARHLHLSEGTVRNHLSSVIRKLGARNRNDAIVIAEQKGWL
jgi:two-component system response regulator DesR